MREIAPFGFRMPPDVRNWVAQQATHNKRSLNSELLVCLEEVRKMREAETVKPQRGSDARASIEQTTIAETVNG